MRLNQSGVFGVAIVCVAGMAASVHAAETVSIGLTGMQVRNATNVTRTSAPATIDPANNYHWEFSSDTLVRGRTGVLGILFPNPVPLSQVLTTLAGNPPPATSGDAPNPAGTHPFQVTNLPLSGSSVQAGVTFTFAATLAAGIDASNVASFSITSVTLTSSNPFLPPGYLEFTQGSVVITRAPIVVCDDLDFNNDGNIDPSDVDAYFSVLGEGPCLGLPVGQVCGDLDFNNDGNIDPSDVDAYFSILGEGPCF